jgi:hypothetical protein
MGAGGDNFYVSGSLSINSLQNSLWNTSAASLIFDGTGNQTFSLAGSDKGDTLAGFSNNFAWGEIELKSGVNLILQDGHSNASAALYVGLLLLDGGLGQISRINSAYNIYYDTLLTGNAYLQGKTYNLTGGGQLIADNSAGVLPPPSSTAAVPLPTAIWLFGSVLAGFFGFSRGIDTEVKSEKRHA